MTRIKTGYIWKHQVITTLKPVLKNQIDWYYHYIAPAC